MTRKKRRKNKRKKQKAEEEKKKKEAEKKRKAEEKRKKEEQKKKKAEEEKKKKIEAEKKRKAEEKRKKEADAKRKAEEALKQQLAEEQRAQTQSNAASALGALVDRIASAVESNWRRPLNSASGLVVVIRVKVARSGEVLSASVVKSSGDQFFDQSAEVAIRKASPLPFPTEPQYYEFINEFDFKFNPDDF